MKRLAFAALTALVMGHGMMTHAQDSIVGTYTGTLTLPRNDLPPASIRLVIASVENGAVKGTMGMYQGPCRGNHPMQGRYDGKKLAMKTTAKGSGNDDCIFGFHVVQEGDKFVGATGLGWPIEFYK